MPLALPIARSVPLAPLTTFGLGGPALSFAEVREASELTSALDWARGLAMPVFILGGGSNLVVADEGFSGLVLHMRTRGRRWSEQGGELVVEAAAGEAWDDVVADAVARNAAGIECLSGIPGSAGAAPVQNIGAYGQEVASVVRQVRVLDRQSLEERWLDAIACGFGYRDSIFKREPERFVILSVTLGLAKNGAPSLRYPELAAAVGASEKPHHFDFLVERQRGVLTQGTQDDQTMYPGVELEGQVFFHRRPVDLVAGGELGGQGGEDAAPLNAGHGLDSGRAENTAMIYQDLPKFKPAAREIPGYGVQTGTNLYGGTKESPARRPGSQSVEACAPPTSF